jgi:hypothetical protein
MNEIPIHCDYSILKPVEECKPNPANPNSHDETHTRLLCKMLTHQGWREAIIVSKQSGLIVCGHGRLKAAKILGAQKVPVDLQDFENEADEHAHMIADNRIAELSTFDLASLKDLLVELDTGALDMEVAGFDERTLEDLMTQFHEDEDEEEEIPSEPLNEAWQQWAGEVARQYETLAAEGSPFSGVTKGAAKIHFLKAKHQGKAYPRFCSTAFHPHQFRTNADTNSVLEGLQKVSTGDIQAERLRFFCGEAPNSSHLYGGSLPFAGSRMPLDFPAVFAKELIDEFGEEGRILDPCCGWGGRLVGFLLSDASQYHGVDVSPLQIEGVQSISETLEPLADGEKKVSLECSKFEDTELKPNSFDFALTSPPYFDVEKYDGGEQSHELADYPTWRKIFYHALIGKTFAALKKGKHFALQIGSQRYPLLEDGKNIAEEVGFAVDEVRQTKITNHFQDTPEETAEVILLLRKP